MIKIKNIAWATAVSAAMIAVLYKGQVDALHVHGRRGVSVSGFPGHIDDHSAARDPSAYYRAQTEEISPSRPAVLDSY